MFPIIAELLDRFNDQLEMDAIIVDRDAIPPGVQALQDHLPAGLWLIACDPHTWEAAGQQLAARLDHLGLPYERHLIEAHDDEDHPICTDDRIDAYRRALTDTGAVAGLAVGSGTLNDIVKMGAFQEDLPMAVVGTAPSMNGYTSAISAVLSDGVKTTQPCAPPRVIITDVEVMAQAPYRMICSGLGDQMSKPVSNADWQLSAWLNGTYHSAEAMEIIEAGADMLVGVAPKLPERDVDAVASLTASLMLSGIAMSVAGSSSPASGGEHLISHFIDMTAIAHDLPHDFHGCQVGVGTITTGLLYERLRQLSADDIDVDARVDALAPWEDYAQTLRERFGPLFGAVVKHAQPGYPSKEELRDRLTKLRDHWHELDDHVGDTLRTGQSLRQELLDAQCPTLFSELGVQPDRARRAITHSKDIRNRYTILHLGWELGLLDDWAQSVLPEMQ